MKSVVGNNRVFMRDSTPAGVIPIPITENRKLKRILYFSFSRLQSIDNINQYHIVQYN